MSGAFSGIGDADVAGAGLRRGECSSAAAPRRWEGQGLRGGVAGGACGLLFPVTQDDDVAVIDDEDVGEVDGPAGWVLAGPWCACWRGAGQSVVTSVTAARALCSSTMFLRPAMAATRAWVARLLTARGRPRAASWIKVVASLLNRGSARPASLRWWVMYPAVCSAVMAGMAYRMAMRWSRAARTP